MNFSKYRIAAVTAAALIALSTVHANAATVPAPDSLVGWTGPVRTISLALSGQQTIGLSKDFTVTTIDNSGLQRAELYSYQVTTTTGPGFGSSTDPTAAGAKVFSRNSRDSWGDNLKEVTRVYRGTELSGGAVTLIVGNRAEPGKYADDGSTPVVTVLICKGVVDRCPL